MTCTESIDSKGDPHVKLQGSQCRDLFRVSIGSVHRNLIPVAF